MPLAGQERILGLAEDKSTPEQLQGEGGKPAWAMTVLSHIQHTWAVSVWSWQDGKTAGSSTCIEGQREVSRSRVTSKSAFLHALPSWPKCDQVWSNIHAIIWQPKEGIANDFFNSQHSKILLRSGVTFPYLILKGCPTFMVPIYGITLAQKYKQTRINALKSHFHRK